MQLRHLEEHPKAVTQDLHQEMAKTWRSDPRAGQDAEFIRRFGGRTLRWKGCCAVSTETPWLNHSRLAESRCAAAASAYIRDGASLQEACRREKGKWEEGKRLERSVTLPSLSLGLSAVRFQFLLGVLLQIRILLQGGLRGYPFLHSRTESRIRLSACAGPLGANPRTENV